MKISSSFNYIINNYNNANEVDASCAKKLFENVRSAFTKKGSTSFLEEKDIQQLMQFKDGLVNLKLNQHIDSDQIATINQVIKKVNNAADKIIKKSKNTASIAEKNIGKAPDERKKMRQEAIKTRENHVKKTQATETAAKKKTTIRKKNQALIKDVTTKQGTQYLDTLTLYYGDQSRYLEKTAKWIDEAQTETLKILGDDIQKKPLNQDEIQKQFETILMQKVLAYNLNKLNKVIPDLFTNSAYPIDQVTDWIPGIDAPSKIGETIVTLPFDSAIINHIKAKLQAPTSNQPPKKPTVSPLERHIAELKKKSDREVLGINNDATTAQVKKAFRRLALKCHPDKIKDRSRLNEIALATETFKRLQEAYHNLMKE